MEILIITRQFMSVFFCPMVSYGGEELTALSLRAWTLFTEVLGSVLNNTGLKALFSPQKSVFFSLHFPQTPLRSLKGSHGWAAHKHTLMFKPFPKAFSLRSLSKFLWRMWHFAHVCKVTVTLRNVPEGAPQTSEPGHRGYFTPFAN